MASDPVIHKYAPQRNATPVQTSDRTFYNVGGHRDVDPWVMVNDFRSRYYSGLDISVYFGDVFIDEIVQLQYQEMEQTRPMFGYADYTFRDVIHGSRIVQGSFAINFKDAGYIPTLLMMLKEGADESAVDTIAHLQARYANNAPDQQARTDLQYLNDQLTWSSERIALSKDVTLEDIVNVRNGVSYNPNAYSALMDNLKRNGWGEEAVGTTANLAERVAGAGERNTPKYSIAGGAEGLGFDIVIKYGQPEDYQDSRPGWGTIEVIKDCHITGVSKAIDDTGRNVLESYTFLARTLD